MNKAFVTLLIRSFRGGQATIAHYFYAISYYIIAVTGGGCFERTKISFIPFQGRIQRSAAITYPFEEQPDKERENCPCRKAIINPFDAMMMVVVRRLDKAYLELKRSKPPAKEAEFALRNAKLSFYGELVRQSIETVFSPEEIIALYENDDLAGGAWTVWNDIGCPVDKILIIIAKLSINEPIQKAVADLLM